MSHLGQRLCALGTAALLVAVTALAHAQAGDQAEKDLAFAQGLYTQQNYPLAAEKFVAFAKAYPTHANMPLALFRAGECLYRNGKYAEAEPYFQRLTQQFATAAEAKPGLVWLGDVRFQLKKFPEAAQAYGAFLQQFANDDLAGHAAYWQGESYCNQQQYEPAIAAYQQALARKLSDEEGAYARYALGWAYLQVNQPDKALPSLQQVPEKFPTSPVAAECDYLIGEAQRRQKNIPAAVAAFQKVVAKYPNSPFAPLAQQGLAYLQFDQKDYGAALESFKAVAAKYANTPAGAEARLRSGDCLFYLKRFAEAAPVYEQVAGAGDKWADEALYWLGVSSELIPKPDAAIAAYQKLIATQPKSPRVSEAQMRLARLQMSAGQGEAAIKAYQAAADAATDPKVKQQALLGLAWARHQAAPTEATLAQLEQAVRQDPKLPLALEFGYQAAVVHFTAARYQPALDLLDLLATNQPEHPRKGEVLYLQAACEEKLDRSPQAEELYRRVLRESKNPETTGLASAALVGLLARQGKLDQARKMVDDLAKSGTAADTRARALVALGQAYLDAKQTTPALQCYNDALKLSPDGPAAAPAQLGLAWVKLENNDPGAAEAFAAVARRDPKSPVAQQAAEGLLAAAEKRFEQQKFPEAQALYQQFLELFPGNDLADEARYKLAWTLLKQNDNEGALAQFQQTVPAASNPAVAADARVQAARLLLAKGDSQGAATLLAPFATQYRDTTSLPQALVMLGRAQTGLKQYDAARATFQSVQTQCAQDAAAVAAAWLGLGRVYRLQRQLDPARDALNKCLATATGAVAAEAQTELALTLKDKGDTKQAAEEFLKVAILYGDPAWAARAQYEAGQCYEQLKDTDTAIKCYELIGKDYATQQPWADQAKARLAALGR